MDNHKELVKVIKRTLLISTLLISSHAIAEADVSIRQCAKWNKSVEKHQKASRDEYYKEWHQKRMKEAKQKMLDANCPTRHNEYFK